MSLAKKNIAEMKSQIEKERKELENIEKNEQPIPELINSTNILRLNEHLKNINGKKDTLLQAYGQYTIELESLLKSMLQVQTELKTKLTQKQVKSRKRASRQRLAPGTPRQIWRRTLPETP